MIGQVLGHYRIVAKIGEGGMGVVYRAYDEVLHRDVALKVVKKVASLDPLSSQRLLHEARASSSLAHPNICTIYEVGETDGDFYIVMELVEGKSLAAMSAAVGLAPESVLRYGVQVASALARAHDRGIVHRDLKTANIVITADGLAKVLDFGLAKQVGSGIFEGPTRSCMYVAISAGGVYRTNDGGTSWTAQNQGIRCTSTPDKYPEFGQCVHKIALHPDRPERLFLQNHWGLYRSDNGAENWVDIANGVPSDFGFVMLMHPRNPDGVYIIPVESDQFRCACDGRLRVYRTRNSGASWEPLVRGLPQKRAYETVLRDAIAADSLDPVGIYFGTRSGQLFGSRDEGRTWQKILDGLPSVVCVRHAVVEDGCGGLVPSAPKAASTPARQTKSLSKSKTRQPKR